MKHFLRTIALVGAALLLAGILLGAVLTGAFWDEIIENRDEFTVEFSDVFEHYGIDIHTSNNGGPYYTKEDANSSYSFTVPADRMKDITEINFGIATGNINIVQGDEMSISVTDMIDGTITSEVEDGVWYIKDSLLHSGSTYSRYEPKVEITIPAGWSFEKANFEVAAGKVVMDELIANNATLKVSAGSMKIYNLLTAEGCDMEVGAGELKVYAFDGKNILVENGVGTVYISGKITGNNKIDCGIGSVELILTDRSKIDFSYSVSCDIGQVKVGDNSYSGDVKNSDYNKNLDDYFDLNCGIGLIEIKTN